MDENTIMNEELMELVEETVPTKGMSGGKKAGLIGLGIAAGVLVYKGVKKLRAKKTIPYVESKPVQESEEDDVIEAEVVKDLEKKMNA